MSDQLQPCGGGCHKINYRARSSIADLINDDDGISCRRTVLKSIYVSVNSCDVRDTAVRWVDKVTVPVPLLPVRTTWCGWSVPGSMSPGQQ